MNLRQKVLVLAVAPIILATTAIAAVMYRQAQVLAIQQRTSIEQSHLASREEELKHYTALATQAVAHLSKLPRSNTDAQAEAKRILSRLSYGKDGYFFIYDLQGNCLMHARRPEMVGQNWLDMRDKNGAPVIRNLLAQAHAGGGTVRYTWPKPSSSEDAPKLSYVTLLEPWGWIIGTGIYLDDVEAVLNRLDRQTCDNINNMMLLIAAISIASATLITLTGLALNVSESRMADSKLQRLTQRVVHSQESERTLLSRDLHDAIGQALVSIRLEMESAMSALDAAGPAKHAAKTALANADQQLGSVFNDVRRISHGLRPPLLDDLGLAAALRQLASEMSHPGTPIQFVASGNHHRLADTVKTALFRIAQEALNNACRHANASAINMTLFASSRRVRLIIADRGTGFNVHAIAGHPRSGLGLRNMHERLLAVGGTLRLRSSSSGTIVTATAPRIQP